MNLDHAASDRIIEHYNWTTLPHAATISDGKIPIPHVAGNARVGEHIREKLPELTKQTMYLWHRFYVTIFTSSALLEPTFSRRHSLIEIGVRHSSLSTLSGLYRLRTTLCPLCRFVYILPIRTGKWLVVRAASFCFSLLYCFRSF